MPFQFLKFFRLAWDEDIWPERRRVHISEEPLASEHTVSHHIRAHLDNGHWRTAGLELNDIANLERAVAHGDP